MKRRISRRILLQSTAGGAAAATGGIAYSFFVLHYVPGLTGSVKG